jgi:hypothetical protein
MKNAGEAITVMRISIEVEVCRVAEVVAACTAVGFAASVSRR